MHPRPTPVPLPVYLPVCGIEEAHIQDLLGFAHSNQGSLAVVQLGGLQEGEGL